MYLQLKWLFVPPYRKSPQLRRSGFVAFLFFGTGEQTNNDQETM